MRQTELDRARSLAKGVELPESVRMRVLEAVRQREVETEKSTGSALDDATDSHKAVSDADMLVGMACGSMVLPAKPSQQAPMSYRAAWGIGKE